MSNTEEINKEYPFTIFDSTGKQLDYIHSAYVRKGRIDLANIKAGFVSSYENGVLVYYDLQTHELGDIDFYDVLACLCLISYQKHKDGKHIAVARIYNHENRQAPNKSYCDNEGELK